METITKFTLYIGLNDKNSKQQEISTLNASKLVTNIAASIFGGCTISEAIGVYKHDDGTMTIETTLRVEILFATVEQIKTLVNDLKKALNQECIAVQKETVKSELW